MNENEPKRKKTKRPRGKAQLIAGRCIACGARCQAECPTDAIVMNDKGEPLIDTAKCIGCAKCVKGCKVFKNRSLYLQIDRKLCVNCNQCAIASACPAQAIVRVPLSKSYLLKDRPE